MASSDRQTLIDPGAFAGSTDLAPSALALLELCRASLCEDDPASALVDGDASWRAVYELAQKNSLEALAWESAQHLPGIPDDVRKSWKQRADVALYRYLLFGEERAAITDAMTAAGLAHLPLKGIVISELYPKPHLRTMCDNDILYGFVEPCPEGGWRVCGQTDEERQRTTARATRVMTEIMEARGYTAQTLHVGNADCYEKRPFFNFEMHRIIAERALPFYNYYENPWSRAILDDEGAGFHFRPEDVYLYHLAHMAKHLIGSGCGLRHIVDHWVMTKQDRIEDTSYIESELKLLELTELEAVLGKIVSALFDGKSGEQTLAEAEKKLVCHLAGCGTHGSFDSFIANRALSYNLNEKHYMLDYAKHRLYPDEEDLKQAFPWFHRHRIALPLLPAYRAIRGLLTRSISVRALLFELRTVRKNRERTR